MIGRTAVYLAAARADRRAASPSGRAPPDLCALRTVRERRGLHLHGAVREIRTRGWKPSFRDATMIREGKAARIDYPRDIRRSIWWPPP